MYSVLRVKRYVKALVAGYRLKHVKNIDRKVDMFWEYRNQYHYWKPGHVSHIECGKTSCVL